MNRIWTSHSLKTRTLTIQDNEAKYVVDLVPEMDDSLYCSIAFFTGQNNDSRLHVAIAEAYG